MPPGALFSAVGLLLILLPLGGCFGTSPSPSPDPADTNEAPGGSHRGNILGDYTEVGCGVFFNNGDVTLAQAFR